MTPRVDVTYLTIPVHAEDIAQAVRTSGHSCFPVVHDDLDDLIGILFVNDIFRTGGRGPGPETGTARSTRSVTPPTPARWRSPARCASPTSCPSRSGVLEALADMRKHRRAVAVVVDEYGGRRRPPHGQGPPRAARRRPARRVRRGRGGAHRPGRQHPVAHRRADQRRRRARAARHRDPRRRVRHPGRPPLRALRPHPRARARRSGWATGTCGWSRWTSGGWRRWWPPSPAASPGPERAGADDGERRRPGTPSANGSRGSGRLRPR